MWAASEDRGGLPALTQLWIESLSNFVCVRGKNYEPLAYEFETVSLVWQIRALSDNLVLSNITLPGALVKCKNCRQLSF